MKIKGLLLPTSNSLKLSVVKSFFSGADGEGGEGGVSEGGGGGGNRGIASRLSAIDFRSGSQAAQQTLVKNLVSPQVHIYPPPTPHYTLRLTYQHFPSHLNCFIKGLFGLYQMVLLHAQAQLAEILRIISDKRNHPILVHCTVGMSHPHQFFFYLKRFLTSFMST